MGVVPGGAKLRSLEGVGARLTGGDWALCQAIGTIHGVGVQLADTMPMDTGPIVG